jgi:hypothetical protein
MMACWHEVTEIQEKQLAALGESPIETIAESDLS